MATATKLNPAVLAWAKKKYGDHAESVLRTKLVNAIQNSKLSAAELAEVTRLHKGDAAPARKPSAAEKLFAPTGGGREKFNSKRSPVLTKSGQPLQREGVYGGRQLERSSDYDAALVGAWWSLQMHRSGKAGRPSTEAMTLLHDSVKRGDRWVGVADQTYWDETTPAPASTVKALLDDTVSGAITLNPAVVDEQIVITPLLSGQLAPFVTIKDIARGRRGTIPTLVNPTMSWGNAEGSQIQPFNTANMIGGLEWAVYPLVGALELGRDLEADSLVDIGAAVLEAYGNRMKSELDIVIASGDGVTQPLGLSTVTAGVTVNSTNGAGGVLTVGDVEAMIRSLPLEYRQRGEEGPCFVVNDLMFSRLRAIPVGAADARRVFGMGQFGTDVSQEFHLFEFPVRVANGLPNGRIIFTNLKRYRLYRRLGLDVQVTTEGRSLVLANTKLIAVRSRWAGRPADTNCVIRMDDAAAG